MFRKSYVHLQEGYIVHAALYGMFSLRLCKQSIRLKYQAHPSTWDCLHKCTENIPCKAACTVQYSLPDDEHKMFETCRREEEVN